jgi:hypothetical protein
MMSRNTLLVLLGICVIGLLILNLLSTKEMQQMETIEPNQAGPVRNLNRAVPAPVQPTLPPSAPNASVPAAVTPASGSFTANDLKQAEDRATVAEVNDQGLDQLESRIKLAAVSEFLRTTGLSLPFANTATSFDLVKDTVAGNPAAVFNLSLSNDVEVLVVVTRSRQQSDLISWYRSSLESIGAKASSPQPTQLAGGANAKAFTTTSDLRKSAAVAFSNADQSFQYLVSAESDLTNSTNLPALLASVALDASRSSRPF